LQELFFCCNFVGIKEHKNQNGIFCLNIPDFSEKITKVRKEKLKKYFTTL